MKKVIRYQVTGVQRIYNPSTNMVEDKEFLSTVIVPWSEENEEIAKSKAYNGEYTVDDGDTTGAVTPTQLDIIEAQVTYTAMMTDTLLGV